MKADYHLHTNFSHDSKYDMEQCVIDAIDKGLDEICFTDHIDFVVKHNENDAPVKYLDFDVYFSLIEKLQIKYKDKITIRKGLEFGLQKQVLSDFENLYNKYPMDFIIDSCHQVNGFELFEEGFFQNLTQREYNRKYYQQILDCAKEFKHYSVLGHLDLFNRYDPQGLCPLEEYIDLVEEILKMAIEDGKGIELNTSNVRYHLDVTTPRKEILELYLKLGGRIITIGSDSHNVNHLGFGIDEAKKYLKKIGFKEFCTFENMQPIFHKL